MPGGRGSGELGEDSGGEGPVCEGKHCGPTPFKNVIIFKISLFG